VVEAAKESAQRTSLLPQSKSAATRSLVGHVHSILSAKCRGYLRVLFVSVVYCFEIQCRNTTEAARTRSEAGKNPDEMARLSRPPFHPTKLRRLDLASARKPADQIRYTGALYGPHVVPCVGSPENALDAKRRLSQNRTTVFHGD
jgi:hypothetical protein